MAATAKVEEKAEIITAVYKVNFHCPRCASAIRRPLFRTQGVHDVEIDMEKNEIKVKGVFEVAKIYKLIEKWSKKKVELVSPKIDLKKPAVVEKKPTEVKQPVLYSTVVKMYMHCAKCEKDLERKLLRHKGIHSVKIDSKAQTLAIQSALEPDKLLKYLKKKVHKHAEIVESKQVKKLEEKKHQEKKHEEKKHEEKKHEEKKHEEKKHEEKKQEEKKEVKIKSKEIAEVKEKSKVEGIGKDDKVPYFIHYVYAPQIFSDENPNACSMM